MYRDNDNLEGTCILMVFVVCLLEWKDMVQYVNFEPMSPVLVTKLYHIGY